MNKKISSGSMLAMGEKKLTLKQQKFIAAYKGNGVEAARAAGYKGNEDTLAAVAHENLRKPQIMVALQPKLDEQLDPLLTSKLERQKLWIKIANECESEGGRIRALELLGKTMADFTENVKHTHTITTEDMISGSRKEIE